MLLYLDQRQSFQIIREVAGWAPEPRLRDSVALVSLDAFGCEGDAHDAVSSAAGAGDGVDHMGPFRPSTIWQRFDLSPPGANRDAVSSLQHPTENSVRQRTYVARRQLTNHCGNRSEFQRAMTGTRGWAGS